MILLGHISDLHLDGAERSTERVGRTMDHLRALPRPVDALLVTGDIAAVFVGHAHTAAASTFAGRPLLIAPGVINALLMPWEGDAVTNPTQPPGVAFHIIDNDSLVTHYRVVV